MQKAVNSRGDSIVLSQYPSSKILYWKEKNTAFYCPACQQQVIIRSGKRTIAHFSHLPNTDCLLCSGGEGLYHETGKLQLFRWLSCFNMQVELEVYFPEIAQRTDIFVQIGKKRIAVEYQCARISHEEITRRTKGYQTLGIKTLWILGASHLKRKGAYLFQNNYFLDALIRCPLSEDCQRLFFYDPDKHQIAILHHIYPLQPRKLIAKQLLYSISKLHFKYLFQKEKRPSEFPDYWIKEIYRLRMRMIRAYGEIHTFRKWLYAEGYLFQHLPSICFLPIPYQASLDVPFWKWQTELYVYYLANLKPGDQINVSKLKSFLDARYSPKSDPLTPYLKTLQAAGYIDDIRSGWLIRSHLNYSSYTTIEEAMEGDRIFFKQFF